MSKLELFDQLSRRVQATPAGQKKIEELIAMFTAGEMKAS